MAPYHPEYQRDELRGWLTSIISRYETAEDLEVSPHLWRGVARAMLLDAVKGLAEAFPDDRFYRERADKLGV
jgi:hypothetical protein